MQAAIVLNGDPPTEEELMLLDACDYVVAADGGANVLIDDGRLPHAVVGDMESVRPDVLEVLESEGVEVDAYLPQKDQTDGLLALEKALERGPSALLILGGHGGRSAMFLANLDLLRRCLALSLDARMVGNDEEVVCLEAGQRYRIDAIAGTTINIIADSPTAVFTSEGTAYDVQSLQMTYGSDHGVSNQTIQTPATILVEEGRVLLIVERGPVTIDEV